MEEAWELAVVRVDDGSEWSSRHVRLRYQAILSALMFWMFCSYNMTEFNLFGSVKFSESPNQVYAITSSGIFTLFSFLSFLGRTNYENNFRYDEFRDAKKLDLYIEEYVTKISNLFKDDLLGRWLDFLSRFSEKVKSKAKEEAELLLDQARTEAFTLSIAALAEETFFDDENSPDEMFGENNVRSSSREHDENESLKQRNEQAYLVDYGIGHLREKNDQNQLLSFEAFVARMKNAVTDAKELQVVLNTSLVSKKSQLTGEYSALSLMNSHIESMTFCCESLSDLNDKIINIDFSDNIGEEMDGYIRSYRSSLDALNKERMAVLNRVADMRSAMRKYRVSSFFENSLTSVYIPTAVWFIVFFSAIWRLCGFEIVDLKVRVDETLGRLMVGIQ